MTNKEKIIEAFHKVKAMGWIPSRRHNNTGIGKTFEDYMGVVENNHNEPDLYGFEIKSHRGESTSFVTLFTKSPSFPRRGANAKLKDKFGEYNPEMNLKTLFTSIFADKGNSYRNSYSFRLINRRDERRVYIGVFSLDGEEIDCSVYYTYDDIETALRNKLKNLFYVTADSRKNIKGEEEFLFTSAETYSSPSLGKFLDMLDDGKIMFDIRMGFYASGKKKGKAHDYGSCFRIKPGDIAKLYEDHEVIE